MARKRRLNWGPVLWTAAVFNTAAGLAWSPITAVSKARVEGALPTDQDRIRLALQALAKKPALRGGAERTVEELYRRADVRSVKWSQNLFRRGLLEIRYDRPVARFASPPNAILTTRGQIAQTKEPIDALPVVTFFDGAREPAAAFGAPCETQKVADVCSRASSLGIENLSITVQANGAVCLNSGDSGRVALGSPDDLDTKFEKLQEILSSQPTLLSSRREIVLLAPSKPTVRPLGSN